MAKARLLRGCPPKLSVFLEKQNIPTEEFVQYASDLGHPLKLEKTNYDQQEIMDLIGDFRDRDLGISFYSDYE